MEAHHHQGGPGFSRKRGAVAVQVAVFMSLLLSITALTVDAGTVYNARSDLQRTADAAALAVPSTYTTDDLLRIRTGSGSSMTSVIDLATTHATEFSERNPSIGFSTTLIEAGDLATGWNNLNSASDIIHTNPQPKDCNGGGDQFVYDEAAQSVGNGSDQIRAVRLFPCARSGARYMEGDGNFDVLNIGTGNQPVSYSGADVRIDPEAPSSGELLGRLILAR